MKNIVIASAILILSLTACKKEQNKDIKVENSTKTEVSENPSLFDETKTYSYMAEDGSRSTVSYQNEKDHTITIKANNMMYVLDKKDGDADSQMYERNGVEALITKDSMKIMQDNLVIPMVLKN